MLNQLIFVAGLLHFGVLIASALVPQVLDWRADLQKVQPLTRRLVWVYGSYIVYVIIAFGTIAVLHADELTAGSPLGRTLSAVIALFWGARTLLQYGVIAPGELLDRWYLRLGYHGLTATFLFFTTVFTCAAL